MSHREYGKAAMILDNASCHKPAKASKELEGMNGDIKLIPAAVHAAA